MRRYNNLDYILKMDFKRFLSFVKQGKEQERKEQIWAMWLAYLPNMTKETYISFEDYYDRCTGKNIDQRPAEDIIKELEELHNARFNNG